MFSFVENVCVLGAGSTKYGKLQDNLSDITIQASVAAIKSAGIDPKEIGAGYISNVFGIADKQVHLGPVIMSNLGIPEKPSLSIESACDSGSVSFREAFANCRILRCLSPDVFSCPIKFFQKDPLQDFCHSKCVPHDLGRSYSNRSLLLLRGLM